LVSAKYLGVSYIRPRVSVQFGWTLDNGYTATSLSECSMMRYCRMTV